MPPKLPAPPTSDIGAPDLSWGTWGQGLINEWFETAADLIWPQSVITYGRMRHDLQIKAVLSAYILPMMRATWAVDPEGCRSEVVQRVADDLGLPILGADKGQTGARRRGIIWHRHLSTALRGQLTFGHMPFERRYEVDAGVTKLISLGERMPWTIAAMKVNRDGSMNEVEQNTQRDPIPANRLVWYVNDREGSNWAGLSPLRASFGAWLLKHETWRVHATSIRRFGMGVPYVEAPAGATQQMVAQAQQLAANMRVGDSAGIGLPQGFKPSLMGLTGSVPDALGFIKYLDQSIAKSMLAGLIELGQTETGSRALGDTFMDLFLLSLQAVADEVATTATSGHPGMPGIVTDLVDQNWGEDEPAPRIVCLDVGQDYEVTADAIGRLVQYGALVPDSSLDSWIRKRWRLPARDPNDALNPAPVRGKPDTALKPANEQPPEAVPRTPGPSAPADTTGPSSTPQSTPKAVAATAAQTAYIEAAKWDPENHAIQWEQALSSLLLQYRTISSTQRTDLVDQVINAIESGQPSKLALTAASTGDGPGIVQQAMINVATRAAEALIEEAAQQGVKINMERVRLDTQVMGSVARARTMIASQYYAQQASGKALQIAGFDNSTATQVRAADEVDHFLAGLSDRTLRDHLGAALTAAQNQGRMAALAAAPESAGTAEYVAAEFLDKNTCDNCRKVDGTHFGDLAEADAAYPTGGYVACEGMARCRGTVVAIWGGQEMPPKVPSLDALRTGRTPTITLT